MRISKIFALVTGLALLQLLTASYAVPVYDKPDDRELFSQAVKLTIAEEWLAAEKLFKQISLSHPEWPEPKNNLAIVQLKLGKIEQAQLAIEEAVISLPSFKVAQENRKRLYDHAAAMAYHRVIGNMEYLPLPQLQLLQEIDQPLQKKILPADNPQVLMDKPVSEQALSTTKQDEIIPPQKIAEGSINESKSKQQISDRVVNVILAWSKAWSDINIEQYLSAYSTQFTPFDPVKDYTQWSHSRRAKFQLADDIQVELQNFKVFLNDNETQALAEFVQNYKSNKYQDKVIKQLHLILENDRWLIRSERVLQNLN